MQPFPMCITFPPNVSPLSLFRSFFTCSVVSTCGYTLTTPACTHVLFMSTSIQRAVTNSEFDHVGMIVPSASSYDTGGLNLLESTAEGCTVYPLQGRLRAYANGFTHYMCLRRLERTEAPLQPASSNDMSSQVGSNNSNSSRGSSVITDERPSEYTGPSRLRNPDGWEAELAGKLRGFCLRVDGKPYGFSVGKLFQRKELENSSSSTSTAGGAAAASTRQNDQDSRAPFRAQEFNDDDNDDFPTSSPSIRQIVTSMSEFEDALLLEDSQGGGGSSDGSQQPGDLKKKSNGRVAHLFTLPAKELDLAKKKTFFCSELVAAAQLDAGILKPTSNASFFWPGSFAVGGEVDSTTVSPFQYGPEIIIDFKEVEVGKARTF